MIDYTLEFLSNAGVEDVLLYAGAHADQIETYIKYVLQHSNMPVPSPRLCRLIRPNNTLDLRSNIYVLSV